MSLEVAGALVGLLVTGYGVGILRRGNVRKHFIGATQREVTTAADPDTAFAAITRIDPPFRVDDADPGSKRIVLSTYPSVVSFGFLYPIEIEATEGGSKITIGIKPKFLSGGFIVKRAAHERCARTIEKLFEMPSARVT